MDGDRAMQQGEIGESEGGPPAGHPVGHEGTRVDVTEREAWSVDGFAGLAVSLLLLGLGCWMTVAGIIDADAGEGGIGLIVGGAAIIVLGLLLAASLTIVAPGRRGSCSSSAATSAPCGEPGCLDDRPLTTRRNVSVRVRNFETNAAQGQRRGRQPGRDRRDRGLAGRRHRARRPSPWRTTTGLHGGAGRVRVAARRDDPPLRRPPPSTAPCAGPPTRSPGELAAEVAERIVIAGVEIIEVRITAPGLRPGDRPGDAAAPAGRGGRRRPRPRSSRRSRHGRDRPGPAGAKDIVELDEERKAAMVSNLLVVLCGDRGPTPVVNTGSLYT